jgi:AraC-like DNA-binding protein
MALVPRTGMSHGGLPLSINVAPAPDLAPYVARFYVTIFDQPADASVEDFLLNETAMVRMLVRGRFHYRTRDWVDTPGDALLLGAQRRRLRVRLTGAMATAGFAIRPAGWFAFASRSAERWADQVLALDDALASPLREALSDIDDAAGSIARMEAVLRAHLGTAPPAPNPIALGFEALARDDPTRSVAAATEALEVEQRQLEREVRRHFGHPPKTVLRRSRFLDVAAVMRGLAVPDADALAAMRFYDASHLNREFRLFVDMTPKQFRDRPTPLLTPGLEVRQQRKLAERVGEDAAPPWRA